MKAISATILTSKNKIKRINDKIIIIILHYIQII